MFASDLDDVLFCGYFNIFIYVFQSVPKSNDDMTNGSREFLFICLGFHIYFILPNDV